MTALKHRAFNQVSSSSATAQPPTLRLRSVTVFI